MTKERFNLKNRITIQMKKLRKTFENSQKRKLLSRRIALFILNIFKYLMVIGLSFIIVYPLMLQLALALREPLDIYDPTILWIPASFSLTNISIVIEALDYWNALGISLFTSLVIAILQVASTSLAGYSFARLKFKGSNILFGLALFTIIVPQTMIAFPLYLDLQSMGLIGKPMSLFIMAALGMGIKSGVFIYLFKQFFRGIPIELEEAAYIDGCSSFGVFGKIMLPNVRSGILTVFLLAFVWQWNEYFFIQTFVIKANLTFNTLAVRLQSVDKMLREAINVLDIAELKGIDIAGDPLMRSMFLNTAGILVMLPLLIIYFFLQKLFVEGIERSGIVG